MREKRDLIIIGNGVSGNKAALAARKNDPNCSILIVGKEQYTEYAAGALPDYLSGHLTKEQVLIKTKEDYQKNNIELWLSSEVTAIDSQEKSISLADGRKAEYGKLIIATGSFPVQLRKMEGASLPGNFVLKTIQDVDDMMSYDPERVVIVGSGAIGLEGGLALKERGAKEVTVVEMLDWITMKSLDEYTAGLLVKELNNAGIGVYAAENVLSVDGTERVCGVRTNKRYIPCDMVLWAIGVRPSVQLAQDAGVELGVTGGILVDDMMRTNLPDVYACGDCTESTDRFRKRQMLNLLWESAARQGETAGCCCTGEEKEFNGSFAALVTYVGDKPIVAFGFTEKDLEGTEYEVLQEETEEYFRKVILQDGKVVGVQMINTMDGADLLLAQLQKETSVDTELPDDKDVGRYPAMHTAVAAYLRDMRERVKK